MLSVFYYPRKYNCHCLCVFARLCVRVWTLSSLQWEVNNQIKAKVQQRKINNHRHHHNWSFKVEVKIWLYKYNIQYYIYYIYFMVYKLYILYPTLYISTYYVDCRQNKRVQTLWSSVILCSIVAGIWGGY